LLDNERIDAVLCESFAKSAPDNWRINAANEGVCLRKFGRIDIVLEPSRRLGHASSVDSLSPPLAFFFLWLRDRTERDQRCGI
jgi:hypothetical protein